MSFNVTCLVMLLAHMIFLGCLGYLSVANDIPRTADVHDAVNAIDNMHRATVEVLPDGRTAIIIPEGDGDAL